MSYADKPLNGMGLAVVNQIIEDRYVPKATKINDKPLSADINLSAADVGALPITGGELTGNLTGKYITGTWLRTTASGHLSSAATKIPALDSAGWLYYRTAEELRGDIGAATTAQVNAAVAGKQDKLTGTAGQVVGFDASGNPAAQSAESLRGPKGDTGAQGPKGDTGPQGPKGDTGSQGPKGDARAAAGFGTPTATVDANTGTPSVTVTASGANTAKVFTFAFKNLKGEKGDTGATPTLNNTVNSTSTTQAATANAVRLAYELASGKQSKPVKGSFTIPTTGWSTDSTMGYTKYYDVAVSGVTANDRADVIIAAGSVNAAAACGLCPVSETLAGKVRIRASQVPAAAIAAEYWIEKE